MRESPEEAARAILAIARSSKEPEAEPDVDTEGAALEAAADEAFEALEARDRGAFRRALIAALRSMDR